MRQPGFVYAVKLDGEEVAWFKHKSCAITYMRKFKADDPRKIELVEEELQ